MSHTPNYDAAVKKILDATVPGEKVCALTGERWDMTDKEIHWYKHFNVPPLSVSPRTFLRQIMLLSTGYSWWWNKNAETGEPLITSTHPHMSYKVIPDERWHAQDFSTLGCACDPEQPFFGQFCELAFRVPVSAWKNFEKPVNSVARHSLGDQDSYFVEGTISRNAFYSTDSLKIEDCVEVQWSSNIRDSYNMMLCQGMSQSRVARHSSNCHRCDFVFDCHDCEFCFMSFNKKHRKYLFRNEQLTREAWEKKMAEMDFGDSQVFEALRQEFKEKVGTEAVWPEHFNEKCENSTGDHLRNCVNCERSWYCDGAKDSWYTLWGNLGTERSVLGCDPGGSDGFGNFIAVSCQGCKFSWILNKCRNVEYSVECRECENCFGCVGLNHKQFHIFNKPYSEAEYWSLVDALKTAMLERGEYGQVFPAKLMQTHVNHIGGTTTFRYSPEDLARFGVEDFDPSEKNAFGDWKGKTFRNISELPSHINDTGSEWVGVGFMDETMKRPFSIH